MVRGLPQSFSNISCEHISSPISSSKSHVSEIASRSYISFSQIWGHRLNAAGRFGVPAAIKVLACLRVLGTGRSFGDLDDGCRMSRETLRKDFKHFCRCIRHIYGESLLNRLPTKQKLQEIADRYGEESFKGCMRSVDGCKLKWKNCPAALKGQYHNTKESHIATIAVEAWCDRDLYIWHWFARRCGTNNDKTLLDVSPLFVAILNGTYDIKLPTDFKMHPDGQTRTVGYFLVDGIYPPWTIFARPIHDPANKMGRKYTEAQEALRKDIERAFGVLQGRFHILRRESFLWYK